MDQEPWNRVNIAFPGAVSVVRIPFTSSTEASVKALSAGNEEVRKLIGSEILQTEIRVLYELLYILNNSQRGNKTFNALKQVEQCINRLKCMKLDAALQELTEMCPNRIQRKLSMEAGECDIPSQPMLEWLCLKVLGGAQLMSCTLRRCSRAFLLSRQHMKLEEFLVLNMVITGMLSRLWVIARGILVSLSSLYQQLRELLTEVANAHPMPFLTDFSLPADMAQFLGPTEADTLLKKRAHGPHAKDHKEKQQQQQQQEKRKKLSVKVKKQGETRKVKEDLGVAVDRGVISLGIDMKPFLKVVRNFTKGKSFTQKTHKLDNIQKFKKQVGEAATFKDMATHLDEMIPWCKSQKMEREKRLLTFLRLKCQRLKFLEAEGYNVQRKLPTFRREVCWASPPQGPMPRSCRSSAVTGRRAGLRTRLQALRSRFKSSTVRTGAKKKQVERQKKSTELSVSGLSVDDRRRRSTCKATSETSGSDSRDDIDCIFASVGL